MGKAAYRMAWAILVSTGTLILLVAYWSLVPIEGITLDEPVKVAKPVFDRGTPVAYLPEWCWDGVYTYEVNRRLVSDTVIIFPRTESISVEDCFVKQIFTPEIPHYTPPGMYKLRISVQYRINPIRVGTLVAWTEEFEIK